LLALACAVAVVLTSDGGIDALLAKGAEAVAQVRETCIFKYIFERVNASPPRLVDALHEKRPLTDTCSTGRQFEDACG